MGEANYKKGYLIDDEGIKWKFQRTSKQDCSKCARPMGCPYDKTNGYCVSPPTVGTGFGRGYFQKKRKSSLKHALKNAKVGDLVEIAGATEDHTLNGIHEIKKVHSVYLVLENVSDAHNGDRVYFLSDGKAVFGVEYGLIIAYYPVDQDKWIRETGKE